MKAEVHQHAIIRARVSRTAREIAVIPLERFLRDVVECLKMEILIDPCVALGPYGYTGLAGIKTSHIAFHFFEASYDLQFDAYSCKSFELIELMRILDSWWNIERADVVVLDRANDAFVIQQFEFASKQLTDVRTGQ